MSSTLINAADYNGWSVLHYAAEHGHEQVVSQLLEVASPALINATTHSGWTALHFAANERVLSRLLDVASPTMISHL